MGMPRHGKSSLIPADMEKVGGGEAILMYANGVGIIGIGRAMAKCEILKPGSPSRLLGNEEATEWRIPVEWLAWVQDERACRWTPADSPNFTWRCPKLTLATDARPFENTSLMTHCWSPRDCFDSSPVPFGNGAYPKHHYFQSPSLPRHSGHPNHRNYFYT